MKLFGFAGWSGSGKTTVIERVIPHLRDHGLSVSLIKHAHHTFDIDQPGKDSWRHRRAGCGEVLITSPVRWALMRELRGEPELTLPGALHRLSPCDLVLVEGYKRAAIPKLEIHRPAIGKPLLFPDDPQIIGLATDATDQFPDTGLPVLDLSNVHAISEFVIAHCTELVFDKLPPSL
jgi:molybdopterin-guanine dinucleotide biosynthesis protein B